MSQDIIDNRSEKLIDHIQSLLPRSESAKFAVGYFFLSGFESIGDNLDSIKELRLLIGNTSTRQTIEQISEGYKQLEMVKGRAEKEYYAKRHDRQRRRQHTAGNLRETVEVMDQTDTGEKLINSLIKMIEQERLKVKVYTKGRLHAKAYIFDYTNPNPGNEGIGVVGSSNLTLAGVNHNTELNVLVHDNGNPTKKGEGNHAALNKWFDELWEEAEDFQYHLMSELKQSWAAKLATPYDIYMKTLYTLVKDRLEDAPGSELLWADEINEQLADFQKTAVQQAIQKIRDNGGCFVSDVVGLGKSYIGAAIIKHFERTEGTRALIICPKSLEEMWTRYNEIYNLNARVLPMSMLLEAEDRGADLLNDIRYKNRNFVLVDESHSFRRHTNQRYSELQSFLAGGKKVCLLTATPRSSSLWDVYNQIKLFHPEDITHLPIDPPNLKEYFKLVESNKRQLQDLLSHLLIRRMRRHILNWYGYTGDTNVPLRSLSELKRQQYLSSSKPAYVIVGGRHQYFPVRKLKTLRYNIESSYNGIYDELRKYLGRPPGKRYQPKLGKELSYARYGLYNFVKKSKRKKPPYNELKRAGINLRGLIRVLLFKRLESSVHAFRESVNRMVRTHKLFLQSLDNGFVPAGEKADEIMGRTGENEEQQLIDLLESVSGRYDVNDFDADRLREHIQSDLNILQYMLRVVEPITPEKDDKLQKLIEQLHSFPVNGGKCLIFTQFADTAKYVYENLNPGDKQDDIDYIYGADKSKARVVGRFAPKANPQFKLGSGHPEINWLVATDVLAQGLNMQDCDIVINYDLHWNPVKLIQRFGRIDRIGSEHQVIWGINFLPETNLEKSLGIREILKQRIQEIHNTIGEDAKILDESERLNTNAMYAMYEDKGGQLRLFEDQSEDMVDLNEAEEYLRNLSRTAPKEFERIANLRDGIRSVYSTGNKGIYAFCQQGEYQQLMLSDKQGNIKSRNITEVLSSIKCGEEEKPGAEKPPGDYNKALMSVKAKFLEEAKRRQTKMKYSSSLSQGQRYILRELRALFQQTEDDNIRGQVTRLEEAFRIPQTQAIKKSLNKLRRNGVVGKNLLKQLTDIYFKHDLKQKIDNSEKVSDKEQIPRIVCSESLI